jgi:sulfide:quinone oxidoreductase
MRASYERKHVLVAGGGVAGLEAMLALSKLAADLTDVELLSAEPEFVYRPLLVAEPFGVSEALRLDLAEVAAGANSRYTRGKVVSIQPDAKTVETAEGESVPYDFLLMAIGAQPVEAVPGGMTFGTDEQRRRFGEVLASLGHKGHERIAFVVPPGVSWSIAAYELALLTAAERDARRLHGTEILLVTHEQAPLEVFGPSAAELVASRLSEAGISLRTGAPADRVVAGRLRLDSGEELAPGAVVALPALQVPAVPGLPQRNRGFVQTDVSMRVAGLEHVWAAGDATWFPVKQGGLAAQQADVAAQAIAASSGAHAPSETFQPVLRAALITGGAPEFLRAYLPSRGQPHLSAGPALWWPPVKVAGKYLGPFLARHLGLDPSGAELADVSAANDETEDEEEHRQALALVLFAAEADAVVGDFEGALRWLAFAEQLDLVIPASYVARRYEWRRHVEPDLKPGEAVKRIDPSFASADAALSDLYRRVGWMREIERDTGDEMEDHLARLDEGMEQLRSLTRQAHVFKPGAGRAGQDRP